MALWFDGVDITVEVAFTTDPLSATPEWVDITNFVRSYDFQRGGTDQYSSIGAGRLSLLLDNNDRRFDPEYLDGAYVGTPLLDDDDEPLYADDGGFLRADGDPDVVRLLPMKRIRVRATYDSTAHPRFDGYVLGWPLSAEEFTDDIVRVDAVDGSRFLESATLADSAYGSVVAADGAVRYFPLQEQNTSAASDYLDVVGGGFARVQGASTAITTVAESPIGAPNMASSGAPATFQSPVIRSIDNIDRVQTLEAWVDFPFIASLNVWPGAISLLAEAAGDSFIDFGITPINPPALASFEGIYVSVGDAANSRLFSAEDFMPLPVGLTHVVVTYDSTDMFIYFNGRQVFTAALDSGSVFAPSGSSVTLNQWLSTADSTDVFAPYVSPINAPVSHVAVYETTLTATEVAAHYVAGITAYGHPFGERGGERIGRVLDEIEWPAGQRDLSVGDTVQGQYLPRRSSALEYIRNVEGSEDGLAFFAADGDFTFRSRSWQWLKASEATFSDDGSDLPYADIVIDANTVDAIRNQVAVSFRSTEGYVRVGDAASVTAYGPSLDSVSAGSLDSAATARALASYRLRTRKDPRTLVSQLELLPRTAPTTMFPAVLAIEIGDRVTVERTVAGVGAQSVKSVQVRGISERVTAQGEWITRLYLAPAPDFAEDAPYLIVGDSTYGVIGATAGNRIPF